MEPEMVNLAPHQKFSDTREYHFSDKETEGKKTTRCPNLQIQNIQTGLSMVLLQ